MNETDRATMYTILKSHLTSYVQRGDSLTSLCSAHQWAHFDRSISYHVGRSTFRVAGKWRSVGYGLLAVTEFHERACWETFRLADLYRDIRRDLDAGRHPLSQQETPLQLALWG